MSASGPHTPTVLVVDDEPAVVRLCRTILEAEGFTVLSAGGSSEALKLCKDHPGRVDLLLTDLVLPPPEFSLASGGNEFPHVHGHELALRAMRMREQLRVVLMSGNIDKDLAGYGIQKGSLPFISKPFDHHAMVTLLRSTMQSPPPNPDSMMTQPTDRANREDEWFD
ncbi:MAG TPA: response regulator [Nitrospira sp.]|nr:response regulator [Nitrospira sp.]